MGFERRGQALFRSFPFHRFRFEGHCIPIWNGNESLHCPHQRGYGGSGKGETSLTLRSVHKRWAALKKNMEYIAKTISLKSVKLAFKTLVPVREKPRRPSIAAVALSLYIPHSTQKSQFFPRSRIYSIVLALQSTKHTKRDVDSVPMLEREPTGGACHGRSPPEPRAESRGVLRTRRSCADASARCQLCELG